VHRYNGKRISHFDNLRAVLTGLSKRSVTPKLVVIIPLNGTELLGALDASWMSWADFVASDNMIEGTKEIDFWRGGFDHPLWILFSSGTTGRSPSSFQSVNLSLIQLVRETEGYCPPCWWNASSIPQRILDLCRPERVGCFLLLHHYVGYASRCLIRQAAY
jgi:acyl-coenzyme A synthetase/AMP-(fatty) acid ligase